MSSFRSLQKRIKPAFLKFKNEHPGMLKIGVLIIALLLGYAISKSSEGVQKVVRVEREGEFKGKSILGDSSSSVYEAKERSFAKTANELLTGQKKMSEDLQKMSERVSSIESKVSAETLGSGKEASGGDGSAATATSAPGAATNVSDANGVIARQPSEFYSSETVRPNGPPPYSSGSTPVGLVPSQRMASRGPDVITFPVASDDGKEELGIVLPVGSYVRAKIIAGTDATTAEPDPVLLQLDYSHILPNQRKIDLSGCFMTAKAQADLSTERVKMKTMKLSCVSKRGLVFEKEVNGYVADDKDNKFAVSGPVNSKQDRVAAMAFLASVVEGVGKAVQQAQTTQQTTPLGGGQAVMTGDERKYLAGGAAANAAGVVANWYLKQAESLLPSITVGSGRDVWVIVLDNVNLPNDYFKKGPSNDARYAYVSRILD